LRYELQLESSTKQKCCKTKWKKPCNVIT